jgi:hypothetical protein
VGDEYRVVAGPAGAPATCHHQGVERSDVVFECAVTLEGDGGGAGDGLAARAEDPKPVVGTAQEAVGHVEGVDHAGDVEQLCAPVADHRHMPGVRFGEPL